MQSVIVNDFHASPVVILMNDFYLNVGHPMNVGIGEEKYSKIKHHKIVC